MNQGITMFISVIVGIIIVQTMAFIGFLFWMLVVGLPLLAYFQIYALNRYTFRDSLQIETIPEKGYEKHLKGLDFVANELAEIGFLKFDEFYLPISSDTIAYIYHHRAEPIYFCHYQMGKLELYDLVTRFDNGFTLTTANSKNAGNIPRPNHKMLQIFEGRSAKELLDHHLESIKFLTSQGFTSSPLYLNNFRTDFLNSFLEVGRKIRGFLSPPKLIYWMLSGVNKNYCKSIQQQYLAKRLLLP
jgi:hypothetical protein